MLKAADKKSAMMKLLLTEKPDILCIQEHKMQKEHIDDVKITMNEMLPGYQQYWACSTAKKGNI